MRSGNGMSQNGQTLVEAALILPIIMVLLLGVLEFGRILMIQHSLTNAAREGARVGALLLDDNLALSTANNVTQDYLNRTGVDMAMTTVTPTFTMISGNAAVQINIDYDYSSGLIGFIPSIGPQFELHSRVIMRREA